MSEPTIKKAPKDGDREVRDRFVTVWSDAHGAWIMAPDEEQEAAAALMGWK